MSIQILPGERTTGQRALGQISEGLQPLFQQFQQKKAGNALAQTLGLEGLQAQAFAQLQPEQQKLASTFIVQKQKQKRFNDLLESLGLLEKEQGSSQDQISNIEGMVSTQEIPKPQMDKISKIAQDPKMLLQIGQEFPQLAQQIQGIDKARLEREKFEFQKEKEQRKTGLITPERREELTDVLKRQLELLKTGDIGLFETRKALGSQARENRAEFDTLATSIEAAIVPLVGKGTLSKQRFNFILKNLPKSHDTKAKIRGKIKALSREFGIDFSALQTRNDTEVSKKPKQLDINMAQKFLRAAGGDKERARALAKKQGFEF